MTTPLPPLDPREAPEFLDHLRARTPGYLPGLAVPDYSPGWALLSIAARYLETIVQRQNQAPEKHKLAFLDLLGVPLLAAQPARAPMVFQLDAKAAGGIVPAGTQVGAPAEEWAGTKITLEYARRGGGTYGFARLSGGSPWPTDSVWMDVSNDGGSNWIQCGPFAGFPNNPVTSAAYPTSSSSLRKFRACGKVYVLAVRCTPWW